MKNRKNVQRNRTWLDKDGLPLRAGVYLVEMEGGEEEIDVYSHRKKGLCCFSEDIGSAGCGVDIRYDCHVSVQFTGLKFIRRLRNFSHRGRLQEAGTPLPPKNRKKR